MKAPTHICGAHCFCQSWRSPAWWCAPSCGAPRGRCFTSPLQDTIHAICCKVTICAIACNGRRTGLAAPHAACVCRHPVRIPKSSAVS